MNSARDTALLRTAPRRPRRRLAGLWLCPRGATISEYAIAAMMLVSAAGAIHFPRFLAAKDDVCAVHPATCLESRQALSRHDAPIREARAERNKLALEARRPEKLQPQG
jgi:hypothetical protein